MALINLDDAERYVLKRMQEECPQCYACALDIRLRKWFAELRAREDGKSLVL